MSRLDVVVFGATGFTGKHAAIEMARLASQDPALTWGVAGRSQSRLEDLLKTVAEVTGKEQSHVGIIVADVTDEESLKKMCSQAKVVANCCGPYRLYGEPVVRAAIRSGAHHVDVTGEPQFIESMQLKYGEEARAAGVYVVSACGFDSIPNDMGVVFLQQNFGGTVNSVESFLHSDVPKELRADALKHGSVHYGTWESLVYSLANWGELKAIRQKLYPTKLPTFEPKIPPQRVLQHKHGRWTVPFPGSDNSVVYRSQRHLYEREQARPAQFRAYMQLDSWLHAALLIVGAAVIALMARFSFTRSLLLKHPRFFSGGFITREGPSRALMEGTSFRFDLYGEGWAGSDVSGPLNKRMHVRVSGTNPGYGATVVALTAAATTVLRESDNMPDKGGVLTTGAAFRGTGLLAELARRGLHFQVVDSSAP